MNYSIAELSPLVAFWEKVRSLGGKYNRSCFIYANRKYHEFLALPASFNIEGRFDGEMLAVTEIFKMIFSFATEKSNICRAA